MVILFAISGSSQEQKNVVLLDHWTDTSITLAVENARYSDVWGFEIQDNYYCALGSSEGVEIFQIIDGKLVRVDRKPAAFQGYTVVHRDYKTYKNYLYAVCDEGTSTLQIFDLSYLPDSISKVYDSNALFGICHNIFIDTSKAKLYACGANNTGMKVLDLSDPISPALLHDFNDVAYVHDAHVRNDTAYLNCGFDGLRVYNFSGSIPTVLGLLDFYPDQGYNHSGWLSTDGSKYVFTDETEGKKIKLCYINDLSMIQVNASFATPDYQQYVPHNAVILNNLVFVAYYNEGLRIFDSSVQPILEIGSYDTFTEETLYKLNGAWGVFVFESKNQVLISDRQNGIFLFEFPLQILDASNTGTLYTNVPFIDEQSFLIPREHLTSDHLTFSICNMQGSVVYKQENYLNWINIPLSLSTGVYCYSIYDDNGVLLESGKFSKAN